MQTTLHLGHLCMKATLGTIQFLCIDRWCLHRGTALILWQPVKNSEIIKEASVVADDVCRGIESETTSV